MMDQLDVFGETQSLKLAEPKPRDALAWNQPRLFEPQMEGQLTLESGTPPQRTAPGTTTETEDTSDA
jgi:hypothetical protein